MNQTLEFHFIIRDKKTKNHALTKTNTATWLNGVVFFSSRHQNKSTQNFPFSFLNGQTGNEEEEQQKGIGPKLLGFTTNSLTGIPL